MILSAERLSWITASRRRNTTIVLANGCFDLLHVGHIRHLQAAKHLGDVLVVLVTPDAHITKRPNGPVILERDRVEMVNAIRWVDFAVLNNLPHTEDHVESTLSAIFALKPAIYAKGAEYRGKEGPELLREIRMVEQCGGKLVYTESPETHTSSIIDKIRASH